MTEKEFFEIYWQFYLLLEKDFLSTKRYLEIDEFNRNAYSIEYSKQYQAICSEIDVFCKEFCKEIDSSFKGNNFSYYCKAITDNFTNFTETKIKVKYLDKEICPWENWNYRFRINKNGRQSIVSNNPKWWTLYNYIKHQRTTKLKGYNDIPFYKYANQENVIYSLGALYILEMACVELIREKSSKGYNGDIYYEFEKSILFFFEANDDEQFYQKWIIK